MAWAQTKLPIAPFERVQKYRTLYAWTPLAIQLKFDSTASLNTNNKIFYFLVKSSLAKPTRCTVIIPPTGIVLCFGPNYNPFMYLWDSSFFVAVVDVVVVIVVDVVVGGATKRATVRTSWYFKINFSVLIFQDLVYPKRWDEGYLQILSQAMTPLTSLMCKLKRHRRRRRQNGICSEQQNLSRKIFFVSQTFKLRERKYFFPAFQTTAVAAWVLCNDITKPVKYAIYLPGRNK